MKNDRKLMQVSSILAVLFILALSVFSCGGGSGGGSGSDDSIPLANGWESENGVRFTDPYAFNPDIVSLEEGGFRMYFEKEVSQGEHNIYSAFSEDGLIWTQEDGTRVAGANMPAAVALPDGRVRIYYNWGGVVKSSISEDGLVFAAESGTRLSPDEDDETGGIKHPDVIRLPDGTFRMYYDAVDSEEVYRIKTAVSDDGLSWTKQGIAIEPSMVMAVNSRIPTLDMTGTAGAVVDGSGAIRIFFATRGPNSSSRQKGIYMATSSDGTTFTVSYPPVIGEFSIGDDYYAPMDAEAVFTDEGLRLYYWIGTSEVLPESGIYSLFNPSITYD